MTPENAAQAQLLFSLVLLVATVGNSVIIGRKLLGKAEKREIGPQPLQVTAAPIYATRQEVERLAGEVERLRDEMQIGGAELRARIDNLPDRIIAILRNTGAIQ